ncbi:MAG: coproporphyrinogen III oxidase family protein, partial [Thermomicrobium sp.]|nr:coproporphyrinogen III oxidase family protein [Thermomicrobium sp.]
QYEISNWARSTRWRSRHNLIYWRNGFYLGAGAGAHGYLQGVRMVNERLPQRYIERVMRDESAVDQTEVIDPRTEVIETMMLGLRLVADGISASAFRVRHGTDLDELFGAEIAELQAFGLLDWDGERLRLTRRGLLVANEVAVRFLEPRGTLG